MPGGISPLVRTGDRELCMTVELRILALPCRRNRSTAFSVSRQVCVAARSNQRNPIRV